MNASEIKREKDLDTLEREREREREGGRACVCLAMKRSAEPPSQRSVSGRADSE